MTFETFVNQAWSEHAKNTAQVAERLQTAADYIETPDQVPALVQLVTHVYGDHLGLWEEGIRLLKDLSRVEGMAESETAQTALKRSTAVLMIAADQLDSVDEFSLSDQVRIFAMAAGALVSLGNFDRGSRFFEIALHKAKDALPSSDPAIRALAVTSNNIAAALEERPERQGDETELMLTAAQASRIYWEMAGTWLEVQRAEVRMASCYLAASNHESALRHGELGQEICETHRAAPEEIFWTFEVLARTHHARGHIAAAESAIIRMENLIERMGVQEREWCMGAFEKTRRLISVQ